MARMRACTASCVVIMVTVLGLGCGQSPTQRLVGQWQGAIEFNEQAVQQKRDAAGANPIAKAILEKVIQGLEAGTADIELKADGSFTLTTRLGPLHKASFGKWTVLSAADDLVVVQLIDQTTKTEQVSLTFVDDDTFTMEIIGNEAKDLAVFRCTRVRTDG